MDGRVYERNAIQTHINERHSRSGTLKSPITNQPMGTTILPNPQAKNIIETAIKNGDIPEDLAKGWKDKMKKREELEENKRAALTGNGKAAVLVAKTFHFGTDLVMKDNIEAAKWWKLASDAGESLGLLMHGRNLLPCFASDAEKATGIACLTEAAMKGSSLACFYVAQLFLEGSLVEINYVQAIRYIFKGLATATQDDEEHDPFVPSDVGRTFYKRLLQMSIVHADARALVHLPDSYKTDSAKEAARNVHVEHFAFLKLTSMDKLPGSILNDGPNARYDFLLDLSRSISRQNDAFNVSLNRPSISQPSQRNDMSRDATGQDAATRSWDATLDEFVGAASRLENGNSARVSHLQQDEEENHGVDTSAFGIGTTTGMGGTESFPLSIVVDGAGCLNVNGRYDRDGSHEGSPKYRRTVQNNGQSFDYTIYKYHDRSDGTSCWFISIVPEGSRPGTFRDTDLYSAPTRQSGSDLPPLDGWDADQGLYPSPRLFFLYPSS